jgi:hypothetical protein
LYSSSDWIPAGIAEAFKTSASASGTVQYLHVFLDSSNSANAATLGLYSDNGGTPGTRLAACSLGTPTPGAWNACATPGANVAAGSSYWLVVLSPSGSSGRLVVRDSGSGGSSPGITGSPELSMTSLPSSWTSSRTFNGAAPASFYMDGSGGSSPPPATSTTTSTPTTTTSTPTTTTTTPTTPTSSYGFVGSGTVQPWADWLPAGIAEAFKTSASASGAIQFLRLYLDSSSNANAAVLGLYSDSGGRPGTRLAGCALGALVRGAWNVCGVSGANVSAGSSYWLAVLSPSGSSGHLVMRDSGGSGSNLAITASPERNMTGLPASWSISRTFNGSAPASLYADGIGRDTATFTTTTTTSTPATTTTPTTTTTTTTTTTLPTTTTPTTTTITTTTTTPTTTTTTPTTTTTTPTTTTSSPSSAQLFVAPAGSDGNACTQTAPCQSFQRAYRVAQPGQTVQVAGGTYSRQTISYDATKSQASSRVTFQAAPGATPVTGLELSGAQHLAFVGITFTQDLGMAALDRTNPGSPLTTDILVRGGRMQSFHITSAQNVTIDGVDIGHYSYADGYGSNSLYSDNGMPTERNITIQNSVFQGITVPTGTHSECLFVKRIDGLTIRNTVMKGCPGIAIAFYDANTGSDSGSNTAQNVLIENNFLSCGPVSVCYGGGQVAQMDTKGFETFRNVTWRFNSMVGSVYLNGAQTNGRWYGNAFASGGLTCNVGGVALSYNVGISCGGTNTSIQATYVNPDRITGDFHELSLAPQLNFVPSSFCASSGCPGSDIDGQPRPSGGAFDAGGDEQS